MVNFIQGLTVYIQYYNNKENIRAAHAWYQTFGEDIAQQKTYPKIKNSTKGISSSATFQILTGFLSHNTYVYEMVEVKACGHFVQEEQPEQIARLILDFLK